MRTVIGEKHRALRAALSALRSPARSLPLVLIEDLRNALKTARKVTVETERTMIFRNRGVPRATWCEACGAEVQMAGVEAAAGEIGAIELAIYQLVESGALHFTEDVDGRVLVCLNSYVHSRYAKT